MTGGRHQQSCPVLGPNSVVGFSGWKGRELHCRCPVLGPNSVVGFSGWKGIELHCRCPVLGPNYSVVGFRGLIVCLLLWLKGRELHCRKRECQDL